MQSDVVNRVRASREQLEVEIRKLLHEATCIAEQALERARTARAQGAAAVEAALNRSASAERAILNLAGVRQTNASPA